MYNITIMTTNRGCDIDVDHVYGYRLPPKYMNKSTSELSYPLHHCLPDVTAAIFSEKAINCTTGQMYGVLLLIYMGTPPYTHTHTHTHTHCYKSWSAQLGN